MSSTWIKIVGTQLGKFALGLTGVLLKNEGGNLIVRNNTDTNFADITAKSLISKNTQSAIHSINEASGIVTHDLNISSIFNHTNIASDFTIDVINMNLSNDYATEITLILNQNSIPRIPITLQITDIVQSIIWKDGTVPAGRANKKDVLKIVINRIDQQYTVYGELTSFG